MVSPFQVVFYILKSVHSWFRRMLQRCLNFCRSCKFYFHLSVFQRHHCRLFSAFLDRNCVCWHQHQHKSHFRLHSAPLHQFQDVSSFLRHEEELMTLTDRRRVDRISEAALGIRPVWGAVESSFPSSHCKCRHSSWRQQPKGSRINVIFSDKQRSYSLISISEWPLCLRRQTDGPIVAADAWETSDTDNNTLREARLALMQSDWVILMKLSSNLSGRERKDGGGREERKKPFLCSHYCLLSTADLWPSDRKERINGKTWTSHEPDGSAGGRLRTGPRR